MALLSIELSAVSSINVGTGLTISDTDTNKYIKASGKYFPKTGGGTYLLKQPASDLMAGITIGAGRLKIDIPTGTTLDTNIQFTRNDPTSPTSGANLPQVLETTNSITISTVTKNDSTSASYTLKSGDVISGTYDASYKIDSSHGPVDALAGATVTFADTIATAIGTKLTITTLQGVGDLRIGKGGFPAYMCGDDDPVSLLSATNPPAYPKGQTGTVEVLSALPAGAGNYTVTDGKLTLNPKATSATGTITVEDQAILDCSKGVTSQHLPSGTLILKAGTNPNSCATIFLSYGTFDKAISIS